MDAETIVGMAQVALGAQGRIPSEGEIRRVTGNLFRAFHIEPPLQQTILQMLMARLLVKMDTGFVLVENHVPWVKARRAEIDPFYWDRYKRWLQQQGFPVQVISGLDRTTDNILDVMGNPAERDTWKRRGLVVGDVQSGKTATYSGLICKAADAGYRFIVLLTGTIENLRRQTQERLDSGFVGFDSSEHLKRNRRDLRVGVGVLDARRNATVFTSSAADFNIGTLNALGLSLSALKEPALVVIKKHTSILQNLRDWVRGYNLGHDGAVDIPMLLIDDEADNASINTNDPEKDPTRVNAGIRELLAMFRRTTYVGFTATPFANIFVNPDSREEMLGDDLFPRDFIYSLQAPTNYFGARRIFLDDSGDALHVRRLQDVEDVLPARHKSTAAVTSLPPSLHRALHVFLVANAIRDLRGEVATHRSMLVNVSQFTKVQDQFEELLRLELDRIRTDVRNFSSLPPAEALANDSIRRLNEAWQGEYAGSGFDWPAVQAALHDAVSPVTSVAVNQRTGPRALDYRLHRESGLRVVAVGGNSLSRGLTLEGLMVSYFRRTSKMYDTLLQMGRWFGYRPGYQDLCRVWLPQEAIDWYGHISEATEELRAEVKRMFDLNRSPKDFGLAVRAHPDSLLVTARNKMRAASEITRVISVSGQAFESVELPAAPAELKHNWQAVSGFLTAVRGDAHDIGGQPYLLRGVPRRHVVSLLRSFRVPYTEFRFRPEAIAELLDQLPANLLSEWDIAVPSGDGLDFDAIVTPIRLLKREMRRDDPPGILVVSGSKRRVGSRGGERAGLTDEQVTQAKAKSLAAARAEAERDGMPPPKSVNVSDRFYRAERTRPLLLLHFLEARPVEGQKLDLEDQPVVALGLSFPTIPGEHRLKEATYKINLVKARELHSAADDADDEDDAPVGAEASR